MLKLTPEELEALQKIDTPTLCNAIETFDIRGRVEGFLGMSIRCLFPELGPMVGYALTVTVDSTTPDVTRDNDVWREWVIAMDRSPKPVVLVFQDVGPQPEKSAHVGEVMATLAQRLGVVGLVTNGGVRDLAEVRELGMHYFAPGSVSSHGNPRLLSVGQPVVIDGVRIETGDLIHGDLNGITLIPEVPVADLLAAVGGIRCEEGKLMDYIKSPDFSVEGFFERKFKH